MQGLWSKLSTGLKFLCFDKNYLTCDPESDRWKGIFIGVALYTSMSFLVFR